jgi:uncharacterized damage-inducible protein DinB
MNEAQLLTDAFDRIKQSVHNVVAELSDDQLSHRVDGRANSIAWLVWHLTRIQDDHVAGVAGHDQVWLADGWHDRFGLPLDPHDHGYGHSSADVSSVRASAQLLTGYHDAVHERTVAYLATLSGADLDRVVDEHWDPPVTLGVRLVSVVNDDMQHVGQAAFVRGLL